MATGLLVCLMIASIVVSARWCILYRDEVLIDVDEAGYLRIAMADYLVLQSGGPLRWLLEVLRPGLQPPLVPAVTSLLFLVFGPGVLTALWVPMLFAAAAIGASFALAKRLSGDIRAALWAATLVATCPLFVIFSRDFHFSVPAAALLTVALWAMAASDRLRRVKYVIWFGIAVGLLPLTRTMTIAFLPGLFVGALCYTFADRGEVGKKLRNLILACIVACLAAASWLLLSLRFVAAYLLDFGYGSRAEGYGPISSVLDPLSWRGTVDLALSQLYLPHGFILAVAGLLGLPLMLRGPFSTGGWRQFLGHPLAPSLTTVVFGLAALTSSPNKGSAFLLPLVPVALAMTGYALSRAGRCRPALALGGVVVAGLAIVPQLDETWAVARPWEISLPVVGRAIVTSGRGYFSDHYNVQFNLNSNKATTVPTQDRARWIAVSNELASYLESATDRDVAFGSRHVVLGAAQVTLRQEIAQGRRRGFVQLDPFVTSDDVAAYQAWLAGAAAQSCILLTAEGTIGDFLPLVSGDKVDAAARLEGFSKQRTWLLPGARTLVAWARPQCQG